MGIFYLSHGIWGAYERVNLISIVGMSVRKFSQILPILLDKERGEIAGLTIFQNLKLTYHVTWHIVCVWIQCLLRFALLFFLFFFFSSSTACVFRRTNFTVLWTVIIYIWLFSNFFIKNKSNSTILDIEAKVFKPKLNRTVPPGKPWTTQNYDPFNIKNHSM